MRLALALLLLAAPAWAEGADHRLSVTAHSGVNLYLSRARTAGGLGGGFGVRDLIDDRYFLSLDLSYLAQVGNALDVRLGAGIQRRGTWNPAASVVASSLFGSRLTFLVDGRTEPAAGPAASLGVHLAPLRFSTESAHVTALELGAGAGWDFPGLALSIRVVLLQVGAQF